MAQDKIYLGERIQLLLDKAEMSQADLAKRIYVSTPQVSDWCNDILCPRLPTLHKIADLFHVSLDWLVTGEEYRPTAKDLIDAIMDCGPTPDETVSELVAYLERRG